MGSVERAPTGYRGPEVPLVCVGGSLRMQLLTCRLINSESMSFGCAHVPKLSCRCCPGTCVYRCLSFLCTFGYFFPHAPRYMSKSGGLCVCVL